jgi:TPR repeat protein
VAIVIWSTHSIASQWVRLEAGAALDQGKLVPMRVAAVKVPLRFRDLHTIDLADWIAKADTPLPDPVAEDLSFYLKPERTNAPLAPPRRLATAERTAGAIADPPRRLTSAERRDGLIPPVSQTMFGVAMAYYFGREREWNKAFEAFGVLAAQGHPSGQFHFGVMHEMGQGVARDVERAMHWYEGAAERRYEGAVSIMRARGYRSRDTTRFLELFRSDAFERAEKGDRDAQYYRGLVGWSQPVNQLDTASVRRWFEDAADQGHEDAKTAHDILTAGF